MRCTDCQLRRQLQHRLRHQWQHLLRTCGGGSARAGDLRGDYAHRMARRPAADAKGSLTAADTRTRGTRGWGRARQAGGSISLGRGFTGWRRATWSQRPGAWRAGCAAHGQRSSLQTPGSRHERPVHGRRPRAQQRRRCCQYQRRTPRPPPTPDRDCRRGRWGEVEGEAGGRLLGVASLRWALPEQRRRQGEAREGAYAPERL